MAATPQQPITPQQEETSDMVDQNDVPPAVPDVAAPGAADTLAPSAENVSSSRPTDAKLLELLVDRVPSEIGTLLGVSPDLVQKWVEAIPPAQKAALTIRCGFPECKRTFKGPKAFYQRSSHRRVHAAKNSEGEATAMTTPQAPAGTSGFFRTEPPLPPTAAADEFERAVQGLENTFGALDQQIAAAIARRDESLARIEEMRQGAIRQADEILKAINAKRQAWQERLKPFLGDNPPAS